MMVTNERGTVLGVVLVAGIVVTVLATAALNTAGYQFHQMTTQRRRDEGFYLAEAGVQLAFMKLQKQLPPFDNQAGWAPGESRTVAVTLYEDDGDLANDRAVNVTVTRDAANPRSEEHT